MNRTVPQADQPDLHPSMSTLRTTTVAFALSATPLLQSRCNPSQFCSRPSLFRPSSRRSARLLCAVDSSQNGANGANGTDAFQIEHPIFLMACDMDGTMLNSRVQTSARNIAAVKRLINETDVLFVPATGKSRAGALKAMAELGDYLKQLYPTGCPGVFQQGLVVYGVNGELVYENACDDQLAKVVIQVARELELSLIAYSRDAILCEQRDDFVDLLPTYHEPQAEEVGNWERVIGKRPLNKFIFMAEPRAIDKVRPFVQEKVGEMGVLTQAQGNMLEVLPPASSKGMGVKRLLGHLGIRPENVLAVGDAENDLEMLKLAGYSCAVQNALQSVKDVAKFTDVPSNDEHGVAHVVERFVLSRVDVGVVEG